MGKHPVQCLGKNNLRAHHGGQKTRKKKAAIALARKIAVVAWAMLKNETDWDPEKAGINLQSAVDEDPSKNKQAAVIT